MRFLPCAPLFVLLACPAFAQKGVPSKYAKSVPKPTQVVATVDGKPLTAAQVEPLLWEWFGKAATQDLISFLLVTQDAAKRGLVIADSEVEQAVDEQLTALQASRSESAEQSNRWLEDQGFTRSRLFLRLKAKLLMDKVLLAEFQPERYVKVSTILVRTSTSDASAISAAIEKAQKAYERLAQGEKWDEVLKATTSEQRALQSHGVLGWRELSAFPESAQKEIRSLKPGAYTKPAQTASGIQIFRVDSFGSAARGKELDELKNTFLEVKRPDYVKALQTKMKLRI